MAVSDGRGSSLLDTLTGDLSRLARLGACELPVASGDGERDREGDVLGTLALEVALGRPGFFACA